MLKGRGVAALIAAVVAANAQGAQPAAPTVADLTQLANEHCTRTSRIADALRQCARKLGSGAGCASQVVTTGSKTSVEPSAEVVYAPPADDAPLAAPLNAAQQMLQDVVTASPVPSLNGVNDSFLAPLASSVLQAFGELEEPQTLGFVEVPFDAGWFKVRVGAFATPEPELNPVLKAALIERNQLETFAPQERGDLGDDYYVTVDVTVLGPLFGREIEHHAKPYARVGRTALMGKDADYGTAPSDVFNRAFVLIAARPGFEDDPVQLNAAACALEIYEDLRTEASGRLARSGVNEYWRFVHNQPQLTLTWRRLHREAAVGADAESWRVKANSGLFNNVNWLRMTDDCSYQLGKDACPQRLKKMAESIPMRIGLGAAAYYERGSLADITLALPPLAGSGPVGPLPGLPGIDPEAAVTGDEFFIGGGDYQRYGWSVGFGLKEPSASQKVKTSLRLDGGVDYYRYDNDGVRDSGDFLRLDHEVTRITLTYRRGVLSVPFHLMYRTETEFTTEPVDDVVLGVGAEGSFFY